MLRARARALPSAFSSRDGRRQGAPSPERVRAVCARGARAAQLDAAGRAAQGEDDMADDTDDEAAELDPELLRPAAAPEAEAELLPVGLAPDAQT